MSYTEDLRFSERVLLMLTSCEIQRRVLRKGIEVSETSIVSIFTVENSPSNKVKCIRGHVLARLIFGLEDGCDNFLRNIGSHTDHTEVYPRR
jgi:hypothetical protein